MTVSNSGSQVMIK